MTAMPVKHLMTTDEFLTAFEDDPRRFVELVDGEVVVAQPKRSHSLAHSRLITALTIWTRAEPGRGEALLVLDTRLDERNLFVPDISWYGRGRIAELVDAWPYPVPDLAAEVRSESTWRYDIGAKKSAYERHGLPELWLVDTAAAEVLVFRRAQRQAPTFGVALELTRSDRLTSPLLPGFELSLDELFDLD